MKFSRTLPKNTVLLGYAFGVVPLLMVLVADVATGFTGLSLVLAVFCAPVGTVLLMIGLVSELWYRRNDTNTTNASAIVGWSIAGLLVMWVPLAFILAEIP